MNEISPKQKFDANFSPANPVNLKAAKDHHLKFDPRKGAYVDEDGALVRDRFGQPY